MAVAAAVAVVLVLPPCQHLEHTSSVTPKLAFPVQILRGQQQQQQGEVLVVVVGRDQNPGGASLEVQVWLSLQSRLWVGLLL